MPDTYTWDQLIDDLSYFIDELNALKPLVETVPVYENPGEELSIEELLLSIDIAQCAVIDDCSKNFFEISEHIKAERFQRGDVDINDTISKLIRNRNRLLEVTKSMNGHFTSLSELVIFERKQLRTIAEHILTITSED